MGIEGKPHRRSVLKEILAAGGAAAASVGVLKLINGHHAAGGGEAHASTAERETMTTISFGDLAGKRNGGLAEWYFNYHGRHFPETLETSFPENLARMWAAKVERAQKNSSAEVVAHIQDFGTARVEEYETLWKQGPEAVGIWNVPEGLTAYPHFTHLVNEFSEIGRTVLENLDWAAIAEAYGFDDPWYVNMLGYLGSRAHGRSLAAYSMTEVMPYGGQDAALNIPLYNLELREAGPEWGARKPALFDPLISYGPFQFTKFAIEEGIAAPQHRYAMNQYLPEELRVPSSIEDFTPDKNPAHTHGVLQNHATAALLFGLQNVAIATRELMLSDGRSSALDAVADMDGATFTSVLAMHHYRPAIAKKALLNWARRDESDAQKTYHAFATDLDPQVGQYGERSSHNYEAIERYFAGA